MWTPFSKKSGHRSRPAVHMTRASRVANSLTRSAAQTRLFLKRQIWVFPILAIIGLSFLAYVVSGSIERTMKSNLRSQLETLLAVEKEMLLNWYHEQQSTAGSISQDPQIRAQIMKMLDAIDPTTSDSTTATIGPLHFELLKEMSVAMSAHDFEGYILVSKDMQIISATDESLIGNKQIIRNNPLVSQALEGHTFVSPPAPSILVQEDQDGVQRIGVPTMYVCAPVRDANFQIVAAIGFRIQPEKEFTRIMQLGRIGDSGETYAFNKNGVMISNSRFENDLILLGLLPDQENIQSLLNIQIRDPGGDMTQGFRPKVRRSELPLTKAAADTLSGNSGSDVIGYNDYRGVPVIGAWTWLPDFQIGVVTEIDRSEAFRPLTILQRTFWFLYAMLGLASVAIFIFSIIVARMQREAQKAAIANKKLGQYTLERKLGEGAMGVVYKGHHAILRRPTAIKMLNMDRVNQDSIDRFEREVQITSQLNNPHTVAIYDYGRTEEGIFYYAMEYLDGIDLQELGDKYGPQSDARVIQILLQICSSLYEAHSSGLVHRDIKPANIMLNRRGGVPDLIKVLDFGLVKAIDDRKQQQLTQANSMAGTPLYMSPEAIQTPAAIDARSDLYAVGAVGYFLLTGTPPFMSDNLVDLCRMHISEIPQSPSVRLGRQVCAELEQTLLDCLDKNLARRPQTARDIILRLEKSDILTQWSIQNAEMWWSQHERGMPVTRTSTSSHSASVNSSKSATNPANLDQTFLG
jgi:serine/threonine protein kinase